MSAYRETAQYHSSSSEEEESRIVSSSSSEEEETQTFCGVLSLPSTKYHIMSYLGEGTFGKVAKCLKKSTNETVAVKIIKDIDYMVEAEHEVKMLEQLRAFDGDRYNFVKFFGSFVESERVCLEFEVLDVSLWDYMAIRSESKLTLNEIRPVLYQTAITLQLLESQGIVHSDLKPENIMLMDRRIHPMKIKVIDFGLAQDMSQVPAGAYLQTRYYRAPEVIVGTPVTPAIDMWSVGCIAAEMYLGNVLYPGISEYDMLRRITQTQGKLPQKVLMSGMKTKYFFKKRKKSQRWALKALSRGSSDSSEDSQLNSLDDVRTARPICHLSSEDVMAEKEDLNNFVDLLKEMLHLDPGKRMTPSMLLRHPFIAMTDLTANHPDSFYVKSACDFMKVCQDVETDEQPSTSSAGSTPVWRNYKEHPAIESVAADMNRHSLQFSPLSSPKSPENRKDITDCSAIQTRGVKRKRDFLDEDGSQSPGNGAGQLRKRRKRSQECPSDATEKTEEAPVKLQRKRRRAASAGEDKRLEDPDTSSPAKKKMKLMSGLKEASRTEGEPRPQRKRSWDIFVASHTESKELQNGSPERKRRRMNSEGTEEDTAKKTKPSVHAMTLRKRKPPD